MIAALLFAAQQPATPPVDYVALTFGRLVTCARTNAQRLAVVRVDPADAVADGAIGLCEQEDNDYLKALALTQTNPQSIYQFQLSRAHRYLVGVVLEVRAPPHP